MLGVACLVCKRRSRHKAGAPSKSPDLESPSKSPYRLSSVMVDQETIVRAEFPVIVFESTRKAVDEGRYASAPQGEVELQALRQVLTSPPAAAELDESPIFGIAELDESQLDESPQDQMRRFEWIRHFVRLNELQKAYDLGWDGKAFQLTNLQSLTADVTNTGEPPSQPRTLPFTSPQAFSGSEIQRTARDSDSARVFNVGTPAGIAKARSALDEAQADLSRARRMMSRLDDVAELPALARARRSNSAAAEGTTAASPAVAADVGAGVGGSSARQLARAARRSRYAAAVSAISADFGGSSPEPLHSGRALQAEQWSPTSQDVEDVYYTPDGPQTMDQVSREDVATYPPLTWARRSNAAAAEGTTAALSAVAADVGAGVGGSYPQLERAAHRSRDASAVSAVSTDFGASSPNPPRPPRNDCVDLPIFEGCGGRGRESRVVTDVRI